MIQGNNRFAALVFSFGGNGNSGSQTLSADALDAMAHVSVVDGFGFIHVDIHDVLEKRGSPSGTTGTDGLLNKSGC